MREIGPAIGPLAAIMRQEFDETGSESAVLRIADIFDDAEQTAVANDPRHLGIKGFAVEPLGSRSGAHRPHIRVCSG